MDTYGVPPGHLWADGSVHQTVQRGYNVFNDVINGIVAFRNGLPNKYDARVGVVIMSKQMLML